MQLKLQVTNSMRQQLGADFEHVFTANGGTIGRAPHNDWVLPDAHRYVSGVHASIEVRDNAFYLVDTSMNGVFVDGSEEAVGPTNPIRLQPNTKLRMGNYRMRVVELVTEAGGAPELLPNHNTTHSTSADLSIDLLEESDLAGNIDLEEILDDRIMSSNMSMIAKAPVFENSVGDQTRTGMID
ncbi:MAG: FHA domain-containing protein, partial [Pseudomonadota bacterium]